MATAKAFGIAVSLLFFLLAVDGVTNHSLPIPF